MVSGLKPTMGINCSFVNSGHVSEPSEGNIIGNRKKEFSFVSRFEKELIGTTKIQPTSGMK